MVDSTNLPDVDINQIATDLNNKMDRDGVNAIASVCIESWHDNNGNWYRVYSDGWCEQGGITAFSTSLATVNFLKTFIDTNYTINLANSYIGDSGGGAGSSGDVSSKTISSIQISQANGSNRATYWEAKGYIR